MMPNGQHGHGNHRRAHRERGGEPKDRTPKYHDKPVHKDTVGACAPIPRADGDRIVGKLMQAMPAIIETTGLEYETFAESQLARYGKNPLRVTMLSVSYLGHIMHDNRKVLGRRSRELGGKIDSILARHSNFAGKVAINGFSWYGSHANIFAATIDTHSSTFNDLQDIQDNIAGVLQGYDIQTDLYPPDHFSLLRLGSHRQPLELDEEHKKIMADIVHPLVVPGKVSLRGLARTVADGTMVITKSPFGGFNFSNELE